MAGEYPRRGRQRRIISDLRIIMRLMTFRIFTSHVKGVTKEVATTNAARTKYGAPTSFSTILFVIKARYKVINDAYDNCDQFAARIFFRL